MNALQNFDINFFKNNIKDFKNSTIVEFNSRMERRVLHGIDFAFYVDFHNGKETYNFLDAVYVEGSFPVPYKTIVSLFNEDAMALIKANQKELDIASIEKYQEEINELQAKIDEIIGDSEDTTGMDINDLQNLFKIEISDRASEVDPDSELDWFSLTLGWVIAKGISPEAAFDFALHIRYHTDLA